MRFPSRAVVVCLALLAGCSEQQSTQPTAPQSLGGSTNYLICPLPDSGRTLLKAIIPPGSFQNSANAQGAQVYKFVADGKLTDARQVMFSLVDTVIKSYFAGTLIGGKSTNTATEVIALINGLYCVVALPAPTLPLGAFGDDGGVAVITPTSPATLVVTGTQFAGVNVPAASVPTTTIVSVVRLPDEPRPLLTQFDQYPAFYEFSASPTVVFTNDVLVGVCQVANFTPPDYSRLKVGHNVGPVVELLPRTTAPFINCANLNGGLGFGFNRGLRELAATLFLPEPAYAATVATCCLGGTTKKFSPFGAVDTLGLLDAQHTSITGTANSTVPAAQLPQVILRTPLGRRMAGITVTFAIPAGSQGSITGATQVTDVNGVATLGGWTLGNGSLPNTVTATASDVPGSGFSNNGTTFTATVTP